MSFTRAFVTVSLNAAAFLPLAASLAAAEEKAPEHAAVASVRAKTQCVVEEVRLLGFATASEESGVALTTPGFRVTEVLVGVGDQVDSGRELLRAVRIGGGGGTSLRAPIAGVVTQVNIQAGAASGSPVEGADGQQPHIRIAAEGGLDLVIDAPSLYADAIRRGVKARILREDGSETSATVESPPGDIAATSQLGRARLRLAKDSGLRSGQFASAIIEAGRDCRVSIPRSAVYYQNGRAMIQVLKESAIETRVVRTGLENSDDVQIRDGLAEGEEVVATADAALRTGDRATPVIRVDAPAKP